MKTPRMDRVGFVVGTVAFALGAIFLLNLFLDMTYTNEGSFDVITGAFVEVFILTVVFEYFNSKEQKAMEKHLQDHLRKIETLIGQKGDKKNG